MFLADQQALTDHAKDPQTIVESIGNVALDYLAVGLDPSKSTIFIQSQIPELAELSMYYMNLVSLARLERNPTVKTENCSERIWRKHSDRILGLSNSSSS